MSQNSLHHIFYECVIPFVSYPSDWPADNKLIIYFDKDKLNWVCTETNEDFLLFLAKIFDTNTRFFTSNAFFQLSLSVALTFSWIKSQMLLRCCLIHKSIIILWHFLYLLYLFPCLDLGLFMLCLCNPFFLFS